MNPEMWAELKFQVQQMETVCEDRCENASSLSQALRWGAEMSMANLILRSMEDLERDGCEPADVG